eukprot:GEZU01023234.1.p1 GENE.GEZU01023234.1~~GEZU01023234.1.p1  ORF type:complete len:215 (+),score=46.26 GEZU01023234.1:485-1129(+)
MSGEIFHNAIAVVPHVGDDADEGFEIASSHTKGNTLRSNNQPLYIYCGGVNNIYMQSNLQFEPDDTTSNIRITSAGIIPTIGSTQLSLGSATNVWPAAYITTVNTSSDANHKVEVTDSTLGLNLVQALRPVSFKYTPDMALCCDQDIHYGFIAQEVEQALTDIGAPTTQHSGLVTKENNGFYSLRYLEFIAILTKAIQELNAEVAALKAAARPQ